MRALTRSRPRKVLMTTDAVGGVFTYAIDLAHGLAAEGVVTVLAVLGPELSPDQRAQAEAVPGLELIVTGIALDWLAEEPALPVTISSSPGTASAWARWSPPPETRWPTWRAAAARSSCT
jgi:hypothetical protein